MTPSSPGSCSPVSIGPSPSRRQRASLGGPRRSGPRHGGASSLTPGSARHPGHHNRRPSRRGGRRTGSACAVTIRSEHPMLASSRLLASCRVARHSSLRRNRCPPNCSTPPAASAPSRRSPAVTAGHRKVAVGIVRPRTKPASLSWQGGIYLTQAAEDQHWGTRTGLSARVEPRAGTDARAAAHSAPTMSPQPLPGLNLIQMDSH